MVETAENRRCERRETKYFSRAFCCQIYYQQIIYHRTTWPLPRGTDERALCPPRTFRSHWVRLAKFVTRARARVKLSPTLKCSLKIEWVKRAEGTDTVRTEYQESIWEIFSLLLRNLNTYECRKHLSEERSRVTNARKTWNLLFRTRRSCLKVDILLPILYM